MDWRRPLPAFQPGSDSVAGHVYVRLKPVLVLQIERVGYLALRMSPILAFHSSPEYLRRERRTGTGFRRCTASCRTLLLSDLQTQPAITPHSCGEGSAAYRQVCASQQHSSSKCCIFEKEWTHHLPESTIICHLVAGHQRPSDLCFDANAQLQSSWQKLCSWVGQQPTFCRPCAYLAARSARAATRQILGSWLELE